MPMRQQNCRDWQHISHQILKYLHTNPITLLSAYYIVTNQTPSHHIQSMCTECNPWELIFFWFASSTHRKYISHLTPCTCMPAFTISSCIVIVVMEEQRKPCSRFFYYRPISLDTWSLLARESYIAILGIITLPPTTLLKHTVRNSCISPPSRMAVQTILVLVQANCYKPLQIENCFTHSCVAYASLFPEPGTILSTCIHNPRKWS